jgi:hypothetical protein
MGDPTNIAPPIQGEDLQINRCGECHQRGGTTNAIPASGGYIRHHEQLNEMRASRHGDGVGVDLTCGSCHNTHIPLRYPAAAGAGLNGIKTECETCHPNHEVMLNGQPKQIECVDCHMPDASKSAVGTQLGNGWKGDVATHIWQINTNAVPRDSMFEGGLVKLDQDGLAAVTLDFACLQCHQNRTLEWASSRAQNIHSVGLAIGDVAEIPLDYRLLQNYPNPFNPSTTIQYELSKITEIRLAVYNLLGQEVALLVSGTQEPGVHKVEFEAKHMSSGMYIYRLESREFSLTKKMVLMK